MFYEIYNADARFVIKNG